MLCMSLFFIFLCCCLLACILHLPFAQHVVFLTVFLSIIFQRNFFFYIYERLCCCCFCWCGHSGKINEYKTSTKTIIDVKRETKKKEKGKGKEWEMLLAVCGFFPNKFLILKSIILENCGIKEQTWINKQP